MMTLDYVNARKAYLERLRGMRSRELENLSAVDFHLFTSRFDPLIKKIETEVLLFEKAQEPDFVLVDIPTPVDLNSFSHLHVFDLCARQSPLVVHSTGSSGTLGWEFPTTYGGYWSVGVENTPVEDRGDVNSGYQFLSA
jgi:hypothetical protein